MGRKIIDWSDLTFKEGQNEFPVSLTQYNVGVYYAVLESDEKRHSFRFIIQP